MKRWDDNALCNESKFGITELFLHPRPYFAPQTLQI